MDSSSATGAGDQLPLFGRPPLVRRSRRQTERALAELRHAGRLEAAEVGRVAMIRTIADLLDHELAGVDPSAWTAARLIAEWRALWAELTARTGAALDDELAAFFASDDDSNAPLRDGP